MPSLYTYTGKLADLGLRSLEWAFPVLRVRPERESMTRDGVLVAAAPIDVDVAAGTGAFSVQLVASQDLAPEVDYILEVGRFENSIDGKRFLGVDVWRFRAMPGGGPVTEQGQSPYAVYVGPPVAPWPPGTPPGLYIQAVAPNAWGIKTEGA